MRAVPSLRGLVVADADLAAGPPAPRPAGRPPAPDAQGRLRQHLRPAESRPQPDDVLAGAAAAVAVGVEEPFAGRVEGEVVVLQPEFVQPAAQLGGAGR